MKKCGIYLIFNLVSGKRYVGSSINIYNRFHEHIHILKRNEAHNKHLQNSWNKYGEESFVFQVLEYCEPKVQFEREQYYIDLIKPEYNLTLNVVADTNFILVILIYPLITMPFRQRNLRNYYRAKSVKALQRVIPR